MTKTVRALKEKILAEMIDRPGELKRTKGGIIIADKDADPSGIKPRWFKVYDVGEGIDWLTKDQYVYVDHGRWSNGMQVDEDLRLYLLDNKDCLVVTDDNPMKDLSV